MLRARVGRGDAAQQQPPTPYNPHVKAQTTRLGLLSTAITIAVLPASAVAAPYIPPGNSAATQYTEAVPTAGGPTAAGKSKQGKNKSPNKVLGAQNTERLDAHGPQGHAAAEVAAETAPSTIETPAAVNPEPAPKHRQPESNAGGQGSQGTKSDGGATPAPKAGGVEISPQSAATAGGGSSGLGEVVSQATGSSSGQLGLLLPLLIVGVIAWSIAYLLRQRKRPAG